MMPTPAARAESRLRPNDRLASNTLGMKRCGLAVVEREPGALDLQHEAMPSSSFTARSARYRVAWWTDQEGRFTSGRLSLRPAKAHPREFGRDRAYARHMRRTPFPRRRLSLAASRSRSTSHSRRRARSNTNSSAGTSWTPSSGREGHSKGVGCRIRPRWFDVLVG
jgi:hypothetical protein